MIRITVVSLLGSVEALTISSSSTGAEISIEVVGIQMMF